MSVWLVVLLMRYDRQKALPTPPAELWTIIYSFAYLLFLKTSIFEGGPDKTPTNKRGHKNRPSHRLPTLYLF